MIVIPTRAASCRHLCGDEEARPAGDIPQPARDALSLIDRSLIQRARITVMRDWEGCLFALVTGDSRLDVLALTSDGRVGHGGVNHPNVQPVTDFLRENYLRPRAEEQAPDVNDDIGADEALELADGWAE